MNGVAWSIWGLIVVLLAVVVREWRTQLRRGRVPDAVRAVRNRHAAPEPDESAPVDVPAPEPIAPDDVPAPAKHSRDIFDRVGADANWATDLAAVPEGELLPAGIPTVSIDDIPDVDLIRPGTPTVSVDDFSDWDLWDAEFAVDLRRLDDKLEAARRLCTANMAVGGMAPMELMQALDRRDLESHERALDHATMFTTAEFPIPVMRPRRLTVPQARRARKRAHRGVA